MSKLGLYHCLMISYVWNSCVCHMFVSILSYDTLFVESPVFVLIVLYIEYLHNI